MATPAPEAATTAMTDTATSSVVAAPTTVDRKCGVCSGWESDHVVAHAFKAEKTGPSDDRNDRDRWGSDGVGIQIRTIAITRTTFDQTVLAADVREFASSHSWYKHLTTPTPFYPVPRRTQAKRHPIDADIPAEKDGTLHWHFFTPVQMRMHSDVLGDVIAEAALFHPVYCTREFSTGNPNEMKACIDAANAAWTQINFRSARWKKFQ